MFDRGFFLTLHAIRRQLAGMPNHFYFIRMIHGCTRRPAPGERLWTAAELMRAAVVRFLRTRISSAAVHSRSPGAGLCVQP